MRLSWHFLLNTSGEVQNLKNTLTKLFLNVMVNSFNNKKHGKQTMVPVAALKDKPLEIAGEIE
jgi:hypothetical protein